MSLKNFFFDDEESSQVTRAHWVPDSKALFCSIIGCGRSFNLIERRHHCRRCGEAVCRTHHGASMKLNQHAIPDVNGVECKVCDDCYLVHQRRTIKNEEAANASAEDQEFFVLPDTPAGLEIPAMIPVNPQSNVFLSSIISHLGEVFQYFNSVRKTLKRCNDSTLKREYLFSEKARFDTMLTAMYEHENAIKLITPVVLTHDLSGYLQECLILVENIKVWAGSTDVYMLRSGKANLVRTQGMLPEEDFAIVEERTRGNERLAESLMARLFDVTREEQLKLVDTLKWVRARMDHDYREYLLVPGSEMESFLLRLEKSIEYIEMHIEMCTGSLQYLDLEATVAGYEKSYSTLLSTLQGDISEMDKDAVNSIKTRTVDLMRDVAICKSLLEKSIESSSRPKNQRLDDVRSSENIASPSPFQPLLNRVNELEIVINDLEGTINQKINEPSGLPRENLHGRAAEMYQSLQVQRARTLNNAIEEEMFDL